METRKIFEFPNGKIVLIKVETSSEKEIEDFSFEEQLLTLSLHETVSKLYALGIIATDEVVTISASVGDFVPTGTASRRLEPDAS